MHKSHQFRENRIIFKEGLPTSEIQQADSNTTLYSEKCKTEECKNIDIKLHNCLNTLQGCVEEKILLNRINTESETNNAPSDKYMLIYNARKLTSFYCIPTIHQHCFEWYFFM